MLRKALTPGMSPHTKNHAENVQMAAMPIGTTSSRLPITAPKAVKMKSPASGNHNVNMAAGLPIAVGDPSGVEESEIPGESEFFILLNS
jgi:hypothetical protein